jgi:hypothetical protein
MNFGLKFTNGRGRCQGNVENFVPMLRLCKTKTLLPGRVWRVNII